jgi:tyrosyl-tRNA synthetase
MTTDPGLLDDLEARGLIQDTTERQALADRLAEGPISVYCGFDPTADSLHVGNLIGLLTLRRFQMAGHRPISLAGGATGMIGDPSGKSAERNLQDDATLQANLAGIVPSLRQFLDFDDGSPNGAKLLDNRAWTVGLPMLEFLRDVGKHVTVNQMVAKESVKNRMQGEDGISYTEFTYMLIQAHDFLWLHEHEGCHMQIGGSDQWGNISLGVDLIRRRLSQKAYGLTWPLLLQKDGTKYGKTAGGDTMWLSPERMSPYRFYQSWIQAEDDDLRKLLLQLTFLSVDEVEAAVAAHNEAPHQRSGQRLLARELTAIVHGSEAAGAAVEASAAVFGGSVADLRAETFAMLAAEIPTTSVDRVRLDEPDNLVPLLAEASIVASKSEATRLLKQNGLSLNDAKVAGDVVIDRGRLLHDRYCVVRKGKKAVFLLDFGAGA